MPAIDPGAAVPDSVSSPDIIIEGSVPNKVASVSDVETSVQIQLCPSRCEGLVPVLVRYQVNVA